MALNDIIFQKQNGGIGRTSASEDPISGLMVNGLSIVSYINKFDTFGNLRIAKISFYEQLAQTYGFASKATPATDADYLINAIDYHVREFFRMSPTGTLYLVIKDNLADIIGDDIKALQNYCEGLIRQVGILASTNANLVSFQTAATALEAEHKPLSIVFTTKGSQTGLGTYTTGNTHIVAGRSNVSMLIGCDLDPALLVRLGTSGYYGCIGTCLGAISAASVNESIAWVQKFPLSLTMPGFITGDIVKEVSTGDLNLINDNRYIFVRTHVGDANNYFNDSFTFDVATSDYSFIENVRTMDKATRGIRANLLPQLNAPLYVESATGQLRASTVAYLETLAGRALEDMERAGELSGYRVEIDPAQNVLATGELEIQIKNVPVGVMRKVLVKIGYTTKLN